MVIIIAILNLSGNEIHFLENKISYLRKIKNSYFFFDKL